MKTLSTGLVANPDFLNLWIGQTISEFGSRITRDALPFIAVAILHASPAQMGLLSVATSVPVLLFGLLAGVWVDRLRRRPIMIAADTVRLILLLLIPLAYFVGFLSLPLLLLIAGAMSLLGLLFETAYRALLPAVIPREQLLEGNSKLSTTDSLAEIGGPALTGVLIQVLGAPLAILFDSLSYVASIFCLSRVGVQETHMVEAAERQSAWQEIKAGYRLIREDPVLRSLALVTAMRAFFGAGIGALYEILALRELGILPAVLGLLVATGGIGALLGAVLVGRIPRRWGTGPVLVAALMVNGVIALCLPLSLAFPSIALILLIAGQIIGDGAMMIYWINSLTLRQSRTPDHYLGRVNASLGFVGEGIAPVGAVLAGLLATWVGVQPVLWIIAGGIIMTGLVALASPLRSVQE